jgi:ubiquitin-protein ligase
MSIEFPRAKIIRKQIMFLERDLLENCTVDIEKFMEDYPEPNAQGDIILYFELIGTEDTPWAGIPFKGKIIYGSQYPTNAPEIRFIDALYHPNVYSSGSLCISILHDGYCEYDEEEQALRWSPAHTIGTILKSVMTLFDEPNCGSPANCEAKNDYQRNRDAMVNTIREKHSQKRTGKAARR